MRDVVKRFWVAAWFGGLLACKFPMPADVAEQVDAAEPDAAPRCDPKAAFGAPIPLTSINTVAGEEFAELSDDEHTIYFSSDRTGFGGYDIYQAQRGSITEPFGNVVPVSGVNTGGDERAPRVSSDRRTLFALSQATAGSLRRITMASRRSTAVAFDELEPLATVNGTANDSDPYVLPDGAALYFTSDRAGNYGLYRSAKAGDMFAAPAVVSGVDLDTAHSEGTPVVFGDELVVWFGSLRPDGRGSVDIYEARRMRLADGFGAPSLLDTLSTGNYEVPNWISPDGCSLYLTRAVADVSGSHNDLFVATRGL